MQVNDKEVHFRLIGEFNAYNLLAVYGAAMCLNQESEKVLLILSSLSGAEGRFDYIVSKQKIIGIVDYAHTPDALENVLLTIKKLRRGDEQVITVVGCGGDRDKTKRPVMAQIAAEFSNRAIFTSVDRNLLQHSLLQHPLHGIVGRDISCRDRGASLTHPQEATRWIR